MLSISFFAEQIISISITILTSVFSERFAKKIEEKELRAHLKKISDWYDGFSKTHESTAIDSQAFIDYINHYNIIEHIIDYITDPSQETEEVFLKRIIDDAIEKVSLDYNNIGKRITFNDKTAIKECLIIIFNSIIEYYRKKIDPDSVFVSYGLVQLQHSIKALEEGVNTYIQADTRKVCPVISIKYEYPKETFMRKIAPYIDLQEKNVLLVFSDEMFETCINEKKLVILGEAGSGKSIAVQQLAAEAYQNGYYTRLYQLDTYKKNDTIEQLVQKDYKDIDRSKLFLIFDGLDEIEEDNQNTFARDISDFSAYNPDTIIVITSRTNFYRFSFKIDKNGMFKGFEEYGIVPASKQDIENYVKQYNIDVDLFFKEIHYKGLSDLITVPFYMQKLIDIYIKLGTLPKKLELMQTIVASRYSSDRDKYITTEDIEKNELALNSFLNELSFTIQCLNKTQIENLEYQELFDIESRKIIDYSGLFSKKGDGSWSFEHNIFREYLAARYMNGLSFDQIRTIICNKEGKIVDSWLNVVSFLILIRDNKDIIEYLIEKDPEILIKFEKEIVDAKKRTEIVIQILANCAGKDVWLARSINSIEQITEFGESKELCEYLIEQISAPANFRAQCNAICVIGKLSCLYGFKDKARKVLFDCIKSENTRCYEKSKAIDAIVDLKLYNDEIANYLIANYIVGGDEHFCRSILSYLFETNKYEDNLVLFISEFTFSSNEKDNSRNGIIYDIINVFNNISEPDNLGKVVIALTEQKHYFLIMNDYYSNIINKSIDSYNNGNADIFEAMLIAFQKASDKYLKELKELIIQFFDATNTRIKAFMSFIDFDSFPNSTRDLNRVLSIGNNECYDYLLSLCENEFDRCKETLSLLSVYNRSDREMYSKFEEVFKKHGETIRPYEDYNYDYESKRREGIQLYFNALFEKETFVSLTKELLIKIGNEEATFTELDNYNGSAVYSDDKKNFAYNIALRELYISLACENDTKIIDYLESVVNWDAFAAGFIHHMLSTFDSIKVSDEQKDHIKSYCNDLIKQININEEIRDEEDSTTYTYSILYFAFFSDYFDFVYDKQTYIDLLKVPEYLFNKNDIGRNDIPEYLQRHLSENDINEAIKENLKNGRDLCYPVIDAYIHHCMNNHYDWAVATAEKICETPKIKSWRKRNAVDYIISIKGNDYVINQYVDTNDIDLLDAIVEATKNNKDERIISRVEQVNRDSDDGEKYLCDLVFFNSKYGLQKYYEILKDKMTVNVAGGIYLSPMYEALSAVRDIALIDCIDDLRSLVYSPGFYDREEFGLSSRLYTIYINMAKDNISVVKEHLNAALQNENISDREKHFCNAILQEIDAVNGRKSGIDWTISSIKAFLNKQK